jgi:hypothetical protein
MSLSCAADPVIPTERWMIRYRDEYDEGCPIFTWLCFAFDAEHAQMKFMDDVDSEGWRIVSIERPRELAWVRGRLTTRITTRYDRASSLRPRRGR